MRRIVSLVCFSKFKQKDRYQLNNLMQVNISNRTDPLTLLGSNNNEKIKEEKP